MYSPVCSEVTKTTITDLRRYLVNLVCSYHKVNLFLFYSDLQEHAKLRKKIDRICY